MNGKPNLEIGKYVTEPGLFAGQVTGGRMRRQGLCIHEAAMLAEGRTSQICLRKGKRSGSGVRCVRAEAGGARGSWPEGRGSSIALLRRRSQAKAASLGAPAEIDGVTMLGPLAAEGPWVNTRWTCPAGRSVLFITCSSLKWTQRTAKDQLRQTPLFFRLQGSLEDMQTFWSNN